MKRQNINRFAILNLGLILTLIFSATVGAQGDTSCSSPDGFCIGKINDDIVIAPGFVANSKNFDVTNRGSLFVAVKIKTFQDSVGSSRYKISLYRGTPNSNPVLESGTEVAFKEINAGSTEKEVALSTNVSCSQIGKYYIRIKNTADENPQMGKVNEMAYDYARPETKILDAPPTKFPLSLKSGIQTSVAIGSFPKPGKLHLYAKWHAIGIIPTYAKISIFLERPNGSLALTPKDYWSLHYKEGSPKFQNVVYEVTQQDANLTGEWRIKINNNSQHDIVGFNIQRGNEPNPFVPEFKSSFINACGQ